VSAILTARSLSKSFGRFSVIENVDLDVKEGTIHALIGPNGAGKTTLFNLLSRFVAPNQGTIHFGGRDVTTVNPAALAKAGLVRSFQISAVFAHLTVLDNVRVALKMKQGGTHVFWKSDTVLSELDGQAYALLDQTRLSRHADKLAGELSYGLKRALEIATTLALEPKLLLLDEPMAGLGREDVHHMMELIQRASSGRTVLMVEHNLSVVRSISDRITVLARGAVLAEGSYAEVSADARVVEAYLGVPHV